MAYDIDGTIVLLVNAAGGAIYELDLTERQAMNDEYSYTNFEASDQGGMSATDVYDIVFIFPEKRSVSNMYAVAHRWGAPQGEPQGIGIYWSDNTTNGADGDWFQSASAFNLNSQEEPSDSRKTGGPPEYRTLLEPVSVESAKAVRFRVRCSLRGFGNINYFRAFHIYGRKAVGETPHRIDFVGPDSSEFTKDLDYGDQPRGTDRTWNPEDGFNLGYPLFLRNRSPEKVAQNVSLTIQALSKNMHTRLKLSKDNGVTWVSTLEYPEIQPMAKTGVIWVRHSIEDNAEMGLYASRFKVDVGSWE